MRNVLSRFPATLLLAVGLLATSASLPAFAQEAEQKTAQSEKPSMEIWKWANFAILAGVLGWLISKNAGPLLVARSHEIREGLAAGEKAKSEAEARAALVAVKLSGLGQAIGLMRADASTELSREGARIQRETAAELARIQQNAAFDIESAGKLARIAVQRHAAKLAIELAEQKVRARMTPELQAALLQNFLGDIGSSSAATGKLS